MLEVIDDRGMTLRLDRPPMRLVSLVPSTTETICDLGLRERLVGRTRFCIRPRDLDDVPKVGGTKDVDVDAVLSLSPDLILANQEENVPDQVTALAEHVPVYVAATATVDGAVADLSRLATLLGADATPWLSRIDAARASLAPWQARRLRAITYIWREPWMACGGDTFVSSVLAEAGVDNVLADTSRYPTVSPETLKDLDPDLVVLPTEPFPFKASHADALADVSGLPRTRFVGMDGQVLTWHGTRLARGLPALLAARRDGWPAVGWE